MLLTHADLADRQRYLNARSTLRTLLDLGVVPVINENDTVVTDEIKFGDNDTLAALVTNLIEADALIILTDQPGLYESDPRKNAEAILVTQADADDPKLEAMAGGSASALAKGGMLTKVLAAQARRAQRRAHRHRLGPRARCAAARRAGRAPRHAAHRAHGADRGAQAVARRPPHGQRPASPSTPARPRRWCATARACCRSA